MTWKIFQYFMCRLGYMGQFTPCKLNAIKVFFDAPPNHFYCLMYQHIQRCTYHELIPLCTDDQGVRSVGGFIRIPVCGGQLLHCQIEIRKWFNMKRPSVKQFLLYVKKFSILLNRELQVTCILAKIKFWQYSWKYGYHSIFLYL